MKKTSGTFSSSVQDLKKSELIEMAPESLAHWRNNLTLSDIGVAAKKVYLVLHDMHRVQLDPVDRLEMLELLRPTVSFICTHLAKKVFDDANILTSKKNKIALLIQTLQLEAAEGYRITIDHLATTRSQKKLLLTAIYRLMTFQYKILISSYQHYALPPTGLWLEMHALYQFSDKHGLLNKAISQDTAVQIRHKNVLDAYKHCLIMGISNPFRLSQNEMQQLNYVLEDWIKLVSLKPTQQEKNLLFVDLDQDCGPLYAKPAGEAQGHYLSLDMEKLTAHIQKILKLKLPTTTLQDEQEQLSALENMINATMLEKLYLSWTQRPERDFERVTVQGKVKVSLGLSSTHYFLENRTGLQECITPQPDQEEIILSSSVQGSDNIPVNSYVCELINESPNGFCLEWEDNPPHQLNALELIGLEFSRESGKSLWLIGSIQWLKQSNSKLQIGVKIISPYAKAIKVRLLNTDDTPTSKWMSGLILPEIPSLKQPQSIITPYLPFKENSKVTLLIDSEEIQGKLKTTILAAHHYKQFTIEYDNKVPLLDFDLFRVGEQDKKAVWSSLYKT